MSLCLDVNHLNHFLYHQHQYARGKEEKKNSRDHLLAFNPLTIAYPLWLDFPHIPPLYSIMLVCTSHVTCRANNLHTKLINPVKNSVTFVNFHVIFYVCLFTFSFFFRSSHSESIPNRGGSKNIVKYPLSFSTRHLLFTLAYNLHKEYHNRTLNEMKYKAQKNP